MNEAKTDETFDSLRARIEALLAGGLETNWRQRAYSSEEVQSVVQALQALPDDDLEGHLRVAGFLLTPYAGKEDPEIEQACRTCMYYEAHRLHCVMPELEVGVKPEWSCILWRI